MEPAAYLRHETAISIAINVALSALFFLAVFGRHGPVAVWGTGGYVFDFLPQGFMIGLMATLVPGLLARRARAAGKVGQLDGASRLPDKLVLRGLVCGLLGAGTGLAAAAFLLNAGGTRVLDGTSALLGKLLFGALVAAITTPAGLRVELRAGAPGTPENLS